jgi:hypothetical protein
MLLKLSASSVKAIVKQIDLLSYQIINFTFVVNTYTYEI